MGVGQAEKIVWQGPLSHFQLLLSTKHKWIVHLIKTNEMHFVYPHLVKCHHGWSTQRLCIYIHRPSTHTNHWESNMTWGPSLPPPLPWNIQPGKSGPTNMNGAKWCLVCKCCGWLMPSGQTIKSVCKWLLHIQVLWIFPVPAAALFSQTLPGSSSSCQTPRLPY